MKDETAGVAINEFVGLKPKIHLFLVDDSSEHKKGKGMNKNLVVTISHNKYKIIMNRIQSNDHRIRAYEINKICLPCFDGKI